MRGARWSWPLAPFSCNSSKKPGGSWKQANTTTAGLGVAQTRRLRHKLLYTPCFLLNALLFQAMNASLRHVLLLHSSSYQLCRTLGQACLPGHPKTATAAWAMHDCKNCGKTAVMLRRDEDRVKQMVEGFPV